MKLRKLIWSRKRRRESIAQKVIRLCLNIIWVAFILLLLAVGAIRLKELVSGAIEHRAAQIALANRQTLPVQFARDEISKIEISMDYNTDLCEQDRPLYVSVYNGTDRNIRRLELKITAALENSDVNFWRHLYSGPDGVSATNQHIFYSADYLKMIEYERVIVENVNSAAFSPGITKSWCIAPELWSLPNYNGDARRFRYQAHIVETGLRLAAL